MGLGRIVHNCCFSEMAAIVHFLICKPLLMAAISKNTKNRDEKTASICCRLGKRRNLRLPKFFCNLLEVEEGDTLLLQLTASQLIISPINDTENLLHNTAGRPTNQKKLQRLLAASAAKRLKTLY